MSPVLILSIIGLYFLMLVVVGKLTSKGAGNADFFIGSRNAPWPVVAFGMIGASLSGVTFISVPGWVGTTQFSYMQMVIGYLLGYTFIALVLMPLYYRLNLTSIYSYFEQRFGTVSYRTGAWFFLLSRTIGSAFRLYLVAGVLQLAVFDAIGVPFFVTVLVTILLIWVYTAEGGIKTIIWTDTLQTVFMLLAVILTILAISNELGLSFGNLASTISASDYSQIFFFDDANDAKYFWKQFLGGAFIAVVMTGMDQDMMQKNLSCKNIGDAQKNMFSFSIVLVFVNLLFLSLGALLYMYASSKGIEVPTRTDDLYPLLATAGHLPVFVGVLFILGLIAAAYSSADSALAALTTSFCIDILDISKKPIEKQTSVRKRVHLGVSAAMVLVILIFRAVNDASVISAVFTAAGYTYGPILGLFVFGMTNKRGIRDSLTPVVCIVAPIVCYVLNMNSDAWLGGYKFGFELLILNGFLTYAGLWAISKRKV